MGSPDVRIDRVLRSNWWDGQTVSLIIADSTLYIIRTGFWAAGAKGSMLSDVSMAFAEHVVGGKMDGSGSPLDFLLDRITDKVSGKAWNMFENALTGIADRDAKKLEARLATRPLAELGRGWMSSTIPLGEIIEAEVSETRQLRVTGIIPRIKLKTKGGLSITLDFPRTPPLVVKGLASFMLALR